jgi:hypothetical protein
MCLKLTCMCVFTKKKGLIETHVQNTNVNLRVHIIITMSEYFTDGFEPYDIRCRFLQKFTTKNRQYRGNITLIES